jgi:plastocyanin
MSKKAALRPLYAVLAAILIGSAFVLGCGGDDDGDGTGASQPTSMAGGGTEEEQAVEQTIRGVVEAYTAGNTEQFLSYWTDEGLNNEFGATADEIRGAGPDFFAGPPVELGGISDVQVDDDSATAEFEFVFGTVLQPQRYILVPQGNAWKISDTASFDAEIPSSASAVEVGMNEFAFEFDAASVKTNAAFRLVNTGQQPHEAVLLAVQPGFTVEALLQADPDTLAANVQIVGFAGPYEPGDDGTMVFTEPLTPGSYMFVCFVPDTADPEQTPHAAKGMATAFEVAP